MRLNVTSCAGKGVFVVISYFLFVSFSFGQVDDGPSFDDTLAFIKRISAEYGSSSSAEKAEGTGNNAAKTINTCQVDSVNADQSGEMVIEETCTKTTKYDVGAWAKETERFVDKASISDLSTEVEVYTNKSGALKLGVSCAATTNCWTYYKKTRRAESPTVNWNEPIDDATTNGAMNTIAVENEEIGNRLAKAYSHLIKLGGGRKPIDPF